MAVIFPEYQCHFRIVGVASGYITYTDFDSVPDLQKVQFVRQITLGVDQSCMELDDDLNEIDSITYINFEVGFKKILTSCMLCS